MQDVWAAGEAYEPYIGRWSRLVADKFLAWLSVPAGSRCLDVGCGTGAVTSKLARIGEATGIDASEGFVAYAAEHVPEASFRVGDAAALPFEEDTFDAAVSGLVLNFVPDHAAMVSEMRRVTAPGGTVAAYVWDYAEGMELLRRFWDVAAALDPELPDEAARFPVCALEPLAALFSGAGLADVEGRAIVVPTTFVDFDDFWLPFLGAQGPAPTYLASLPAEHQATLRDRLHEQLGDGPIRLTARAWAVRGTA
ncbi:MAG TPA: class I SAM-dependent methyltransferase [Nocardioidaceae bacterium]|nr:class I SAM-dependent methyltransferase [Nocardioidaceae bacterium]